ncbi:MAG: single-stranded DNA-binding protein [Clostridia bacterium]|nr:single-stranded DNA-binding protein [Clostridia bacterium]
MNNVSLIGRLTADPELKRTQSGLAMTRFSVAVDRRVKQGEENQADFINIIAWRQTAEFICKYFSKGQRIALTGRIQTGSYTDSEGKKRSTFDVIAENVEFCDSKNSQKTDTKSIEVENTADFEQMPDDKDLPF